MGQVLCPEKRQEKHRGTGAHRSTHPQGQGEQGAGRTHTPQPQHYAGTPQAGQARRRAHHRTGGTAPHRSTAHRRKHKRVHKSTSRCAIVVEVLDKDGEVIENEYTVVFNKPYTFEGETYDKIDLSGLDNLTAADMIAANKILDRTGSFTFLPEMSLEYACIIAAKATKLPVEFFKGLHPKEAVKVKNRVTAFFYGAE